MSGADHRRARPPSAPGAPEGAPRDRPGKAIGNEDTATPALPRCCPSLRLAAVDAIATAVMNDAMAQHEAMVADGWPHDAAVDAIDGGYREWIVGRFGDAVDLAVFVLREVRP